MQRNNLVRVIMTAGMILLLMLLLAPARPAGAEGTPGASESWGQEDVWPAGGTGYEPESGSENLVNLYAKLNGQNVFIANQGQTDESILFYSNHKSSRITVDDQDRICHILGDANMAVFSENFANKQPDALPRGLNKTDAELNYFQGNNEAGWTTGIDTYYSITLGEIWAGIRVDLLAGQDSAEKVFIISPGSDPGQVLISIDCGSLKVNNAGELEVLGPDGNARFSKPAAWQETEEGKKEVEVAYRVIDDRTYGFSLGAYDRTRELNIDPLLYSTLLGDTNHDKIHVVKVSDDYVYVMGQTKSTGFPTVAGAACESQAGGWDIFVSKFSQDLSTLHASTFIGGSGDEANGEGGLEIPDMEIDGDGNIYISGNTASSDFPVTADAYDSTYNGGIDAFVLKLDGSLTQLLSSSYYGGSGDDGARPIKLDSEGNVYIAGWTKSSDLPMSPSSNTGQVSADKEAGYYTGSISVTLSPADSGADVYYTTDGSNPGTSSTLYTGPVEIADSATLKAVAYKNGTAGIISLFDYRLGVGVAETVYAPTADIAPGIYAVAQTITLQCETAGAAVYYTLDGTLPTPSSTLYTAPIEVTGDTLVTAVACNEEEKSLISGFSYIIQEPGYDSSFNNATDAFIAKFSSDLGALKAATYFGSVGGTNTTQADVIQKLAINSAGDVYAGGYCRKTNDSGVFPKTEDAYHVNSNYGLCAFIARFSGNLADLKQCGLFDPMTSSDGVGLSDCGGLDIDHNGNIFFVNNFSSEIYCSYWDYIYLIRFPSDLNADGTVLRSLGKRGGYAHDMKIGPDGDIYVAGRTFSNSLIPYYLLHDDSYVSEISGVATTEYYYDAFVAKFTSDIEEITTTDWSITSEAVAVFQGAAKADAVTGETAEDAINIARSLDFDGDGNVYLAGQSNAADYPVTEGAYDTTHSNGWDGFISVLTSDLAENQLTDYELIIETDEGEPQGGQKIPVMVQVENNGPDAPGSARAVLIVTPSEAVDKIEVSSIGAGDTYTISGNQVTITLGGLQLDIPRATGIGITTKSSYSGSLTFSSTVTPIGGTDSNSSNNSSSQEITVLEQEETCDIYVESDIKKNSDGQYENSITWGNQGTATAINTKLVDTLDPKTVFVTAEPEGYVYDTEEHTVTWELSNVASGTEITDYKVTSELKSGTAGGSSLSDTVEISSDTSDADTTNNKTEKSFGGVININVTSDEDCFFDSNNFGYKVVITNNDSKARNIKANIPIPYGTLFNTEYTQVLDADIGIVYYNAANQEITWESTGGLQSGQSVNITFGVEVCFWNEDNNFCLECEVKAIDTDSGETWEANYVNQIDRPDLVIYSGHYSEGLGNYNIHMEKNDNSIKQIAYKVIVKNNGAGFSDVFKLDISTVSIDDNYIKITEVNVHSNIGAACCDNKVKIDDTDWTLSMKAMSPEDLYIVDIQLETTGYVDYEVDIIAWARYYNDSSSKSDLNGLNNKEKGTINFINFNPVRTYEGCYDPGLGKYKFELTTDYQFKSTASKRACAESYTITQTMKNITAYDNQNLSGESSPKMTYSEGGNPYPYVQYNSVNGILFSRAASLTTKALCDGETLDESKKIETAIEFKVKNNATDTTPVTYNLSYEDGVSINVFKPVITYPENGEMFGINPALNNTITIKGKARPNSHVSIHNGSGERASGFVIADASGTFEVSVETGKIARTDGKMGVKFCVRSYLQDEALVEYSEMVDLTEPYHEWCPQRTIWSAKVGGKNYTFKFREGEAGRLSTTNWEIPGVMGMTSSVLKLWVGCEKPNKVWVEADGVEYDPVSVSGHYYSFNIKSAHNVVIYIECGEEETSIGPDGNDKKQGSAGVVLIDPDGYVFDSTQGWGNVVPGATVTCMMYEEANQAWMQWPAELYEEQINPQTVGDDGYFAFFTPPGTYRLVVENPLPYQKWISPDLTVINEIVHQNIPYVPLPSGDASVAVSVYEAVLVDEYGFDASSLTLQAGQVIEWIARAAEDATADELAALIKNPVIRIQSRLDPENDQKGFDSGLLRPGYSYRYQFNYPGNYEYYYVNGSTTQTGTVVVEGGTAADTASPSEPGGLSATRTGKKSVNLSWTASYDDTGVTGYRVFRRTRPDGEFAQVGTSAASSYTDSDLERSTTYEYYVVAVDAAGNKSHASDYVEVTTGAGSSSIDDFDGGANSSKTLIGIFQYGELEVREETGDYVRLGFTGTILQKYVDAGNDKLFVDLEDLQKKIILEVDRNQLELIADKLREIQLLTAYGKLDIPTLALPRGEGLELSLGQGAGDVPSMAGIHNILSRVEFTTSVKFLKAAALTLEYPVSSAGNEEVFAFISGSAWKPLPLEPEDNTFVFEVTESSDYAVAAVAGNLSDIDQHWARRNILLLNLKGVISGVTETSFEPDRNMTRAEFATIMVKALGLTAIPGQNTFTDVKDDAWYAGFVDTACAQGILSGYGPGKFAPLDTITREQAMATIARALKIKGLQVDFERGEAEKLLSTYEDSKQADVWAGDGIAVCVKTGIVAGKDGKLAPQEEITRSEAAAIITRMLQKTDKR